MNFIDAVLTYRDGKYVEKDRNGRITSQGIYDRGRKK